ncbi:MAG TPA: beta-ketoacyl-[acyl-carrier-protein] synthase family protein [Desulfobacterales bacterium]|nr:beta-ketoacyl-[acyl-carrier-protein] synthase family protein [Desulfobacterales bacterium]
MNRQRPVSVSGMGCICAAGKNLPDCMAALFTQAPTPAPPRSIPGAQHPVFEVPDRFLPASDFQNEPMVRAVRLALAATNEALTDAGLIPAALRGKRVGVVIGTNVGSGVSNRALQKDLSGTDCSCLSPAERFRIVNPAQWLARHFDFSGPHVTIVNACSAGSDAIGLAGTWIRSGRCDVVIAGGTDALYEVTYYGFIALLNSDTGACKPFDIHRNGLNLGEGAAMMVLESEAMLTNRGKKARAFVAGYGTAADAYHLTAPHPEGCGLRVAVQDALAAAGTSPSDIAFINAHGTGTRENDRVESFFFHQAFPGVPFGSTKGYTGHTLGAAGAIEAAFTIAALEHQKIPANEGFNAPDPDLPAHPVAESTEIRGTTALSQTLAFGGNNSVLIFTTGRGA